MAELTIDLKAVRDNYKFLQSKVGATCEVSAVVKANAYGLGVGPVSETLQKSGCKTFFVATLPEALELRLILGDEPNIFMLNGYQIKNASLYLENNVIPVLNGIAEIDVYKELATNKNKELSAVLNFDTAMNRLGLDQEDLERLDFENLSIKLIMSHFASSEDKNSELNRTQNERFLNIARHFSNTPKSLSNSSGIFLNDAYHYNLVRPGMSLYGLNPTPYTSNPMHPVIKLQANILQVHEAKESETAGYNATYRFNRKTKRYSKAIDMIENSLILLFNKDILESIFI